MTRASHINNSHAISITHEEHKARRAQLAQRLPSQSIAIIPAANDIIRNGDAHYRFRQDSDFYYLTGFDEPDALLLITSGPNSISVLFNRPNNPKEEQWTGRRLGQEGARALLGMDEAYSLSELEQRLPDYLTNQHALYYHLGCKPLWEARLLTAWRTVNGMIRQGKTAPSSFCDLAPILGEMRLIKSSAEIACIQHACDVSVKAHQRAMQACRYREYEYQLEADLTHEWMQQGCRSGAYDAIVASGKNACILHYTENHHRLIPGDLLLIDAGAEYQYYAADITRTYPINGRFSKEQRLIYTLVLQAQQAGIACVQPGRPWDDVQHTIVRVLTEGLVELGILSGLVDSLIETEAYKSFYMHNSGHWLGMDVHDVGAYKQQGQWRALEPGMVLTVEPGLYISEGSPGVDPRWWNIGVRIEDDLLVTSDGHRNLTAALAVEIDDLETSIREGTLCGK